ncbi:MAG: beta-propeller fold lactonase family protein, partial [Bacteroidetes bacterium]|nr:beta-propeller fold lactonase family protein [Bacteroidota bacterium]
TATNLVESTVNVGKDPHIASISPDGSRLYVSNYDDNTISVINTTTNTVINTINVTTGANPQGLSISPDGSKLYVANSNGGTISVISTSTNSVIATINNGYNNFETLLSPDGSLLYVTDSNVDNITIINTSTNKVINTMSTGFYPSGMSISPDGHYLYVTNENYNNVYVINTSTESLIATVFVGSKPISYGNFITSGTGCAGIPTTFTITVNPSSVTPTITAGPVSGYASTCVNSPSASPHVEQFTVTGSGLANGITATAPAGFEISLSAGNGYGPSVVIPESGGNAASTAVYVRAAASTIIGGISGNVVLSSPGVPNQNVAVTGFVNFLQTVDKVPNQVYNNGDAVPAINFTGTADSYQWVNNTPSIGTAPNGTGNIASFKAVNTGNTPVTATFTVAPVPTSFAYICNSGGNTVSVIATAQNSVVANFAVGTNPWGVALSPDNTRVYVTNQTSNNVSVINTATRSVIGTINVGNGPEGVIVNNDGSKVYVANQSSANVSVISTATNSVVATIKTGSGPRGLSISPDGSRLYVGNSVDNTVSVINTATNAIIATIPVGLAPFGMVINIDGSKLYVVNFNGNSVSVINTAADIVTATVPVGTNPVEAALSPDGSALYVTNSNSASLSKINTQTNTVTSVMTLVATNPDGLSVTPDGSRIYVSNFSGDNVVVVDAATGGIITTVRVDRNPVSYGDFITASTGCANAPITFTITVNPSSNVPNIVTSAVTGTISACEGSASVSPNVDEFTVSGSNLTSNVTVTAPANFEISLTSGTGFGSSLVLVPTAGTLSGTVIYIRSAASAPVGSISGNITLTSGTISQVVPITGTVNAPPAVNPVNNQTVVNGAQTTAVSFTGNAAFYSWTNDNPAIGLPASGTGGIPAFSAINNGAGPATATITVTPMLPRNEAFIASFNDNDVQVINTETNKIIATIPVGTSPTTAVTSPDGARAYVINGNSYTVSVINTATNTVIATVPVGQVPNDAAVSPDSKTIYVVNTGESSVSVIDATTNKVTSTINIDSYPRNIAISPDGSTLYITYGQNGSVVSIVSASTGALIADVSVGTGYYGITVIPDGSKVYVANHVNGNVAVINTATNTVSGTYPIGGSPWNIMASPDGKEVYEANESLGKITVISTATNTVTGQWGSGISGDWGIGVSPDGGRIYMVDPGSGPTNNQFPASVSVFDTQTGALVARIPAGILAESMHNFVTSGPGCVGTPVTFTITVTQPVLPSVTTSGTLSPLVTTYGTPSASTSFTVSGTNLKEGILATPPPGFEISADGRTFGPTATVGAAGNVTSATVYVRLAATTPVGTYTASIVLSTNGAEPIEAIIPASTVNPAPLTITANDKTRAFGAPNPVFTFTYHSFVNGEGAANLTSPAMASPLATTTSAPGEYTIIVSGAADSNYAIKYNYGTLTITPPPITVTIPNTFTPNGDGINDFWDIGALTSYPQCLVSIYTRYGSLIFQSKGYPKPWDGTYKNSPVPTGTYYYIIDLQDGSPLLSGFVAVVR